MTSVSEASSSDGAAGNLHTVENPAPASARLGVEAAANGTESDTDESAGLGGSGPQVTLAGDENGEATNTEADRAAKGDRTPIDSPIFQRRFGRHRVFGVEEDIGEEQEPVYDENGRPLEDNDGNYFYARPDYHAMRDLNGRVCWDDRHLRFELIEEDMLAQNMTKGVGRTPESLSDQVEQLQMQLVESQAELEQAQFVHHSDVERAQEVVAQVEAQGEADRRVMEAELQKRTKVYQNSIHAHKQGEQVLVEKWMAHV